MIFYDFIFCTVRTYFDRTSLLSTICGILAVVACLMLHIMFIQSIVFFSTGMASFKPADFTSYGAHKVYYSCMFLLFSALVYPFYRKDRVKKITKLYSKKYIGALRIKKLKKMYLYIVAPTVFAVVMNNWDNITGFFLDVN